MIDLKACSPRGSQGFRQQFDSPQTSIVCRGEQRATLCMRIPR